jgi:hypothetical protein
MWKSGCIDDVSLTPELLEGELHASAVLPPEKEPLCTHRVGGWVGFRTGLDDMWRRKILSLPELKLGPSARLDVTSSCIDYAIPAPSFMVNNNNSIQFNSIHFYLRANLTARRPITK